jgi:hypothetical protein
MNIQANINQTLSVAGMLMSQTPMAAATKEKALEKMKTKQTHQRYEKATAVATEAAELLGEKATEADYKIYEMAEGAATEAAEELFKQDPTPETARQLKASYEGREAYYESKDEEMAKKAQKTQQAEQNRLARSAILEGVYSPLTDMPARKAGHEKRLKEGSYTDGTK